jgi:hypothetical protein
MKAKEFEIKKRDPNWRAMQDIRRSGAGGQHKDKKKAAKQGQVKHKGQVAEGDAPDEEYLDKVISDLHKDALGFRPDQEFGREWMSSSFEEKLEIYNNMLRSLNMDEAQDDWGGMSHGEFKRKELQHELGHEDDPDFERKLRQKQMDKDRGPWYIKIDGKIYKQKGESKSFDWKKGANNYALAIVKNRPELKDKTVLTRNPVDQ